MRKSLKFLLSLFMAVSYKKDGGTVHGVPPPRSYSSLMN